MNDFLLLLPLCPEHNILLLKSQIWKQNWAETSWSVFLCRLIVSPSSVCVWRRGYVCGFPTSSVAGVGLPLLPAFQSSIPVIINSPVNNPGSWLLFKEKKDLLLHIPYLWGMIPVRQGVWMLLQHTPTCLVMPHSLSIKKLCRCEITGCLISTYCRVMCVFALHSVQCLSMIFVVGSLSVGSLPWLLSFGKAVFVIPVSRLRPFHIGIGCAALTARPAGLFWASSEKLQPLIIT